MALKGDEDDSMKNCEYGNGRGRQVKDETGDGNK